MLNGAAGLMKPMRRRFYFALLTEGAQCSENLPVRDSDAQNLFSGNVFLTGRLCPCPLVLLFSFV